MSRLPEGAVAIIVWPEGEITLPLLAADEMNDGTISLRVPDRRPARHQSTSTPPPTPPRGPEPPAATISPDDWLRAHLLARGGVAPASDVRSAARADGYPLTTIDGARARLGIKTTFDATIRHPQWELP